MNKSCPTCFNSLPNDAKFCFKCGTPMTNSELHATMCDCGTTIDNGSKFCHNCGKSTVILNHGSNQNNSDTQQSNSQPENFHVLKTVGETLSPDETVKWLQKFRKGQNKGSWIFFGIVAIIVLVVIIFSVEDFKAGALGFGLFMIIFFLLAFFSLRRTNQNLIGEIRNKKIVKSTRRDSDDGYGTTTLDPTLYFKLKSGKKKLVVSNQMYNYFNIGDKIFKISGADYPELQELTLKGRVCMVCGAIMPVGHPLKCKKCKCPVPDYLTLLKEIGLA